MRPFEYIRAAGPAQAVAAVAADPAADYLAGGTTELDLMLKDGIIAPERLVDITRLPLKWITADSDAIRVGATTTMEELAADPTVSQRLPFIRDALLDSASVQLRNMATIGGNLLQRTRCGYFRDPTVDACNKRRPGSGCAAVTGAARMHAIAGASANCIALHASDLAVPLVAVDTIVHVLGPGGMRRVPLNGFYLQPGDTPHIENVLTHGELITQIDIPLLPANARSAYLKVRDRTSYEFALTSAGVAVVLEAGVIRDARIGLGGVGTIPWRAWAAEHVLRGGPATGEAFRAAAEVAVRDPFTVPGTAFKVELAKRTLVRVLHTVTGVTP
jgi:xanthine dehydrogenase YagS FAD-binding subunit